MTDYEVGNDEENVCNRQSKEKNCIKGIGLFVINLILLKILIYMKHLTNFN